MKINHLEDAYRSPNPHDLRDYLDVTPTKDVREDLTNLLQKYADVGFLVHVRDKITEFIEGHDKYAKEVVDDNAR